MSRLLATLVAIALLAGSACGGDRSGGPTGKDQDVVLAAPDRTIEERTARVSVETPAAQSSGTVTFPSTDHVTVSGPPAVPELADPLEVIDLVRGAVDIVAYGGAEVRGASTIRYSFEVDLDVAAQHAPSEARRAQLRQMRTDLGRPTFYADVWIDSQRRIRRVQVPVDRRDKRPGYTAAVLEKLVTVDFYDFNGQGEQR